MLLDLQHIDKSYGEGDMAVPVLHDICLQMEKGEYVAVMGPSGSGKSTLMNIIGLLDEPTAGRYMLDGEDMAGKSDNELAVLRNHTIGFVFQNFNLMPRETALENVALPMVYAGIAKKERQRRAEEALMLVGLDDRMSFFPTQLSGGQRQRVAIARAMIMKPALLLADEPTGALDSVSGRQVMELLGQLNDEGTTILMITHEQEVADFAGRQMVILDGRLHGKEAAGT